MPMDHRATEAISLFKEIEDPAHQVALTSTLEAVVRNDYLLTD